MKLALVSGILAVGLTTSNAQSDRQSVDHVGDTYEIRLEQESRSEGAGSSSNSRSQNTLIERVLEVLEFDLTRATSGDDRDREWQFPARVQRFNDGRLLLINTEELIVRNSLWLERGGMNSSDCGRWVFTWNAFKIECDPQSVLAVLEPYILRLSELRDGAYLEEEGTVEPARLNGLPADVSEILQANFTVDPDAVRRQNANTDIIIAQIRGDAPLDLETALALRSSDDISGRLTVTIETDTTGQIIRRVRNTQIEVVKTDGTTEITHATQTAIRNRIPSQERQ